MLLVYRHGHGMTQMVTGSCVLTLSQLAFALNSTSGKRPAISGTSTWFLQACLAGARSGFSFKRFCDCFKVSSGANTDLYSFFFGLKLPLQMRCAVRGSHGKSGPFRSV